MTEVELSELLESDLAAYNLVVQASQQDECLLITLNRPADCDLDYTALTEVITARIKTLHPEIHTLLLCSRVLGEYEVDWQTQIQLISPPQESPQDIQKSSTSSDVEATVESQQATAPQTLKSDYCFIRNQTLLKRDILPPSEEIAEIVQSFHALPDSSQECILPILKQFFQSSEPIAKEQYNLELQQWLDQLTQINETKIREASIWFSRYCFNPEKTMAEVMVVLELKAAKAAFESQEAIASPPEPDPTTVASNNTAQTQTSQRRLGRGVLAPLSSVAPTRSKNVKIRKTKAKTWQLALPIGWVIFTVIVIVLAVRSVNPSELTDAACKNATGSRQYCHLAAQILGEMTFQAVSQNAVPLTPSGKEQSLKDCEVFGNVRAGKTLRQSIETVIPVLSSSGEEILPGIFIGDVKQTNFKQSGSTIRTACVIRNTETQPDEIQPVVLRHDIIPNNWPIEPYKRKPIPHEYISKALGVYSILIALGAGTLFTAIGIYIAATLGLGIRLDSLEALFQASFFLGIVESIIFLIPTFSLIVAIALRSLALGVVSAVVKGFHVEWTAGYKIIAGGAITILAVKTILLVALFSMIASFVQ